MAFFFEDEAKPVTALFDQDGNQLFGTIGILEMFTSPSNTFSQHTLEDGTVVTDNKIENQTRISVSAVFNPEDFKEAYAKLKEASKSSLRFTIQNRVDTYDSMYIESYPYDESAKVSNTITININFVEQQFVKVKTDSLPPSKVKNQADANSVNSGSKLPVESPTTTLLDILTSGGIL
jgi:hypothetical protein